MAERDSIDPITLAPCPFCGGKAELVMYQTISDAAPPVRSVAIRCKGCGVRTVPVPGQTEAALVWNRRTPLGDGAR